MPKPCARILPHYDSPLLFAMNALVSQPVSLKWSYGCVIFGCIIVAIWCRFIDPVINSDGVKYILASESFLNGNFIQGFQAYKWPLYSLSIAGVSKITGLAAEQSAIVFNTMMRILAGFAFIRLVQIFGADRRQVIIAALVYVFYPGLNEIQSMIIRDIPYLACFLWMVVFFVKQLNNPTRTKLMGFLILGLLATAYRIEGLVYLFGLFVIYLLWGTVNTHWRKVGLIIVACLLPVLVYGLLMWIYDGDLANAWHILNSMMIQTGKDFDSYVNTLDPGIIANSLQGLRAVILILLPFGKLAVNLVDVVTIGFIAILIWGWFNRPIINREQASTMLMIKAWKWVVGINLLVLVGYVLVKQIVTDRYPVSFALLLMLFLPFALTAIWQRLDKTRGFKKRALVFLLGFVLLANAVEGLDRYSSKLHMKRAGQWVAEQTGPYQESKVYSNTRIVDYYLGKPRVEMDEYYSAKVVNAFTLTTRWSLLDFLVINIEDDARPGFYRTFRFWIGKEPEKIFRNRKGDKVLVYDFRPESEKRYLKVNTADEM